jgi:hypothetical protein
LNPFQEEEGSDNEEDQQPSTSRQQQSETKAKNGGDENRQGTMPYIDVDHPSMKWVFFLLIVVS